VGVVTHAKREIKRRSTHVDRHSVLPRIDDSSF
jgi:hypothetical protein